MNKNMVCCGKCNKMYMKRPLRCNKCIDADAQEVSVSQVVVDAEAALEMQIGVSIMALNDIRRRLANADRLGNLDELFAHMGMTQRGIYWVDEKGNRY